MKYKNCEIKLVSECKETLDNWINKYSEIFGTKNNPVKNTPIKKLCFDMDEGEIIDYRTTINFTSKLSKNNIYFLSNNIKSNPITFKTFKNN